MWSYPRCCLTGLFTLVYCCALSLPTSSLQQSPGGILSTCLTYHFLQYAKWWLPNHRFNPCMRKLGAGGGGDLSLPKIWLYFLSLKDLGHLQTCRTMYIGLTFIWKRKLHLGLKFSKWLFKNLTLNDISASCWWFDLGLQVLRISGNVNWWWECFFFFSLTIMIYDSERIQRKIRRGKKCMEWSLEESRLLRLLFRWCQTECTYFS